VGDGEGDSRAPSRHARRRQALRRSRLRRVPADLEVTPHVAQKDIAALDARTTRHSGYGVSQRFRKRVEEVFGWLKTVGLLRQTRHRGCDRVGWMFTFAVAVYNLVRLRTLRAVAA